MENNNNIENQAANMLLKQGISLPIPAPYIFRVFGKKVLRVEVKRLYLGTLLYLTEIATRFTLLDEKEENRAEFVRKNAPLICSYVAVAILNNRFKIRFKRYLAGYLKRHLTADEMFELTTWVIAFSRIESFMNTISLAATMRLTAKMSPTENGSQEE